jgi:hypothetical protein
MKGKRHSPEQVVRKLQEADRLLAEGADVDACGVRKLDSGAGQEFQIAGLAGATEFAHPTRLTRSKIGSGSREILHASSLRCRRQN